MNNLRKNFFIGMVTLVAAVTFSHAQAASVTLAAEVVFGPGLGEMGSIDVTYDDAAIIGFETEILADPDVMLSLTLFGQTFTNSDDIDFSFGFPEVTFLFGEIVAIDFAIFDGIDEPGIPFIAGFVVFGDTWEVFTTSPVPIPAAAWLFGSALLGLGVVKRKKAHA